MREILFRGFHKNPNGPDTAIINGEPVRGEWVYGSLFHDPDLDTYAIMGFEYSVGDSGPERAETWFDVIPSTVGQYTGLTDKSGMKIFTGDILRADRIACDAVGVVCLGRYRIFGSEKTHLGFFLHWSGTDEFLLRSDLGYWNARCEIVGNIHENPELPKWGGEK